MTTAVITSTASNNSLEQFRNWVKGVIDVLNGAGMLQTADTGQIDPLTTGQPSLNSYLTAPSVHSVTWPTGDSLTLRISYGADSSGYLMLLVDWSPYGSNGANALIRSRTAQAGITPNITRFHNSTSGLEYQSYACVDPLTQSVSLQLGGATGGWILFQKRISNVTGLPVVDKDYSVHGGVPGVSGTFYGAATSTSGSVSFQWRDIPYYYFTISGYACIVPLGITASSTNDKYIFPWRSAFPAAHDILGVCTYLTGEITTNSTFQVDINGKGTLRTYRATGIVGAANGAFTPGSVALLWE